LQTSTASSVGGFSGIGSLVGSGSAGDLLIGPNATTTWTITGPDAGLAGTVPYSGFQNLRGGTGMDVFLISPAGTQRSLSGGGAPLGQEDWLDYSSFTTGVKVNLQTGQATNVNGGARGAVSGIQDVRGGSGNDNLTGSSLGSILIGGGGKDTLVGGKGRNLLIGGAGSDTITGGRGQDIIIGGSTIWDASSTGNDTTLMAILQEWQRTDLRSRSDPTGYQARIKHLKKGGGDNGAAKLIWGKTVKDDAAADTLRGDPPHTAALDWFFANLGRGGRADTILDRNNAGTEQIN
jgi:Ca2+-binding RTX toxin-like protein